MTDVKPEPPPAGEAFRAAWRRARTQRARDLRNRRGKRPPPPVTGYRIHPSPGWRCEACGWLNIPGRPTCAQCSQLRRQP